MIHWRVKVGTKWRKYEGIVSCPDLGSSPSPHGLVTQVQKLVLMGGVMSVLIDSEVNKILQALNAV